jgi:hypothetical protein
MENTLKQKQLSDVHLLNVHLINWLKNGLTRLVFVLVLNFNYLIVTYTREQDVVALVYFKVVGRSKSVCHV